MNENKTSTNGRAFQHWIKGMSFSFPVVILVVGFWGSSLQSSVREIRSDLSGKIQDLVPTVSTNRILCESNQKGITILRDWLIRIEGKLDRVLDKK